MAMPAIRRRWTTSNVRALMDESRPWPRYELIDGELVVTPAPGTRHQLVVGEIHRLVAEYVDREPIGVTFMSPADLELVPGTITQPDVFVCPAASPAIRIAAEGWEFVKSLLLAVEVLSPSSLRTDRVEKRELYLSAGVPDYWVVDADARIIERWTPAHETPELIRHTLVWHPTAAAAPMSLDVSALFAAVDRKLRLVGL
jgi:Uma2 family endonuclease